MAANALPIVASFPPSRTDPHTQIPQTICASLLPLSKSKSPSSNLHSLPLLPSRFASLSTIRRPHLIVSCLPSSPSGSSPISTKLYVSGLSFRTTEESLRNAFQNFGRLVEVNLVMDRIANRPRGFAFLRYATDEESKNAIEGMHGKFLDGRVIFVEPAKPRSELRRSIKETPRPY